MLFKRGQHAIYDGKPHIVDHVILRNCELYVHFVDVKKSVKAELVSVEITEIDFNRTKEQANATGYHNR